MISDYWWNRFNALLWASRGDNYFNPWSECDPLDISQYSVITRRLNLETHFDREPKYLLIGEAPGYRGCHFSGVPFTCESQLPYRLTTRPQPWREASATVVHATLRGLGINATTVMWNAFPFHPFNPGAPLSNRAPTKRELESTQEIARMVLKRFKAARVFAVGKTASRLLTAMAIDHFCVRHPSMGGAHEFQLQLGNLL